MRLLNTTFYSIKRRHEVWAGPVIRVTISPNSPLQGRISGGIVSEVSKFLMTTEAQCGFKRSAYKLMSLDAKKLNAALPMGLMPIAHTNRGTTPVERTRRAFAPRRTRPQRPKQDSSYPRHVWPRRPRRRVDGGIVAARGSFEFGRARPCRTAARRPAVAVRDGPLVLGRCHSSDSVTAKDLRAAVWLIVAPRASPRRRTHDTHVQSRTHTHTQYPRTRGRTRAHAQLIVSVRTIALPSVCFAAAASGDV